MTTKKLFEQNQIFMSKINLNYFIKKMYIIRNNSKEIIKRIIKNHIFFSINII